jgi:hypothetical protein
MLQTVNANILIERSTGTVTAQLDNATAKEVFNNTTVLPPVIASSYQLGSSNGTGQTTGFFNSLKFSK